jgi:hypothetical protein
MNLFGNNGKKYWGKGMLLTGAGHHVPAAPTTSTAWNPADKNSNITLSGGNLIATSAGGSSTRCAA